MRYYSIYLVGLIGLTLAGCGTKASASKIAMERVDRSLAGGNQGYLLGTPPSTNLDVGTREMVEVEVVLPATAGKHRSQTVTESVPGSATTELAPAASEPVNQPEPRHKYYKK